jgi:hypothetical protein
MVGLAAEFAVASELCRRDIYAQLTLGHLKRTDLLILTRDDKLLRIEVKGKQGSVWPNCKGICGNNVIMVLVDFAGKGESDRPDFYVLTVEDWLDFVKGEGVEIDNQNVPTFVGNIGPSGKAYKGMGVRPEQVQDYKEKWEKITQAIAEKTSVGDAKG